MFDRRTSASESYCQGGLVSADSLRPLVGTLFCLSMVPGPRLKGTGAGPPVELEAPAVAYGVKAEACQS